MSEVGVQWEKSRRETRWMIVDRWWFGDGLLGHHTSHFFHGSGEHEDVVSGEKQCRDLAQFPHTGTLGVGHDFPQTVQRRVQIMHPSSFSTVDLQSQTLHVAFGQILPLSTTSASLLPDIGLHWLVGPIFALLQVGTVHIVDVDLFIIGIINEKLRSFRVAHLWKNSLSRKTDNRQGV